MATQDAEEDRAILRELCTINGISYDNLDRGSGLNVTKLESFFFGCPHIPSGAMGFFPALTELRIVNQKFTHISGLESCVSLQQLWICEGLVQCIEGLSKCTNLTSLYLYTNRIERIEGLDQLTKLRTLWLNGNLISSIEGLESVLCLRELNLAHNRLTMVGTSLNHLTQLVELNLSGNLISSLQDLVHLSALPNLTALSLCDPLYPPNPVCALCNYSTHVLYHLPSLLWLDGVGVSSEELRLLIEGVVQRKKRFYRMKTHHIRMQAREREATIKERMSVAMRETYNKIREVQHQLKTADSSSKQHSVLTEAMTTLDTHVMRLESQCSEECVRVWRYAEELCQRWMAEMESGGNVRFVPGSPALPWYQSCVDIIQSRFTITHGVTGVEVTGVTKVENRLQYMQFNEKMRVELEKEVFSSLSSWKNLLDYLLLVWEPGADCMDICRGRIGVTPPHVTNSVNLADGLKLAELENGQGSIEGELLLCKVFVGLTSESKAGKVPKVSKDVNCVCHVREGGQKEWFVRDPDLLLPEYIIQVKYSTSVPLADHVRSCDPAIPERCNSTHPRLAMLDEQTLLHIAGVDSLSLIKELRLCDNHLSRFRVSPSLPCLQTLDLSFNELATVEDLRNMLNLEVLNISFNRLSTLDGLKGLPKLRGLDVRGNELTSAHDLCNVLLKQTPSLETLDVRYNPWDKFSVSRPHILGLLKSVRTLNGQSVTDKEVTLALKQVVSSHLSLTILMTHTHTHTHTPHTLTLVPLSQMVHTDPYHRPSHLHPLDNWTHTVTSVCVDRMGLRKLSCIDQLPNLRWLSLAQNCLSSIDVVSACSQLEELVVDGNRLRELPTLHTLTHLTYLSVSDNNLISLPPLLPQLTFLDFSFNNISSLEPLKSCVTLEELYGSGNALCTTRQLFPLKALPSLAVCDLTGNSVSARADYRHFIIYHCSSLKALDGSAVETNEVVVARDKMGGRLCQDLIFERHPEQDLHGFKQLDVTHCAIKIVDLSPVAVFDNLASLNLEHNSLISFSGLVHLNSLKVLCLNHNRIESLVASCDTPVPGPVMLSLQVLHLAYNGIRNLPPLQLGKIPSLRALFLQGNEVSSVEGLTGLHQLSELVLDRNKIKALLPVSFESLTALRELHLEENRLKDLSYFTPLASIQRLYLGMNKIQDFNQLEKLAPLSSLIELSMVSNPVSRRLQHRCLLIHILPSLLSMDGVLISPEERQMADTTFSTTQQEVEPALEVGLSKGSMLKVMNVPFGHNYHCRRDTKLPSDRKRGK